MNRLFFQSPPVALAAVICVFLTACAPMQSAKYDIGRWRAAPGGGRADRADDEPPSTPGHIAIGGEPAGIPGPHIANEGVVDAQAAHGGVSTSVGHDVSPPLGELAAVAALTPMIERRSGRPGPAFPPAPTTATVASADPVLQTTAGSPNPLPPIASFEGINAASSQLSANFAVDASGAVGPNHYFQSVNFAVAIYSKTGQVLLGPSPSGMFWNGFSAGNSACAIGVWSDMVVLYDRAADRWFVSRFAQDQPTGNWYQCFAISTTPDPTGTYYRYAFLISPTEFNDYPKFGIWPDGYYMTANRNKIFSGLGVFVVAFERAKMLAGQPAQAVHFALANGGFRAGMLPADWDGRVAPPAGSPNYLVRTIDPNLGWSGGTNRLDVWAFHVDWTDPVNSTLTLQAVLTTAAFNSALCNLSQNCIPQPSTSTGLDPIAYGYLMNRLAYRSFGSYETLVVNQTVEVGDQLPAPHAGIRWYELRNSGSGWSIHQQATYAPNAANRWIGSVAMDASGNMMLGYNVSSGTVFPSIRVTGRLAGDTPGTLQQEASLASGGGSQTGFIFWGDYSQMTIDPTDDCTFWFVSGYQPTTTTNKGWSTRIGSVKFPSCQPQRKWASSDFNGDLRSDILWRDSSGNVAVWLMNGATIAGSNFIMNVPLAWQPVGLAPPGFNGPQFRDLGDFNGDGRSDILWRNTSTGDLALWLMNGTALAGGSVFANVPAPWTPVRVGDFNGDGLADILWRNTSTGDVALWLMSGTTILSNTFIATVPLAWQPVRVGDFNGDGLADILWRNTSTGDVAIWLMGFAFGTPFILNNSFVTTVPLAWQPVGVGDFDGDGKADLLWWNSTTGDVALWFMNGTAILSNTFVANVPAPWTPVRVGDFNGDGLADILWRNTNTGDVALWLMFGFTIGSNNFLTTVSTSWTTQ